MCKTSWLKGIHHSRDGQFLMCAPVGLNAMPFLALDAILTAHEWEEWAEAAGDDGDFRINAVVGLVRVLVSEIGTPWLAEQRLALNSVGPARLCMLPLQVTRIPGMPLRLPGVNCRRARLTSSRAWPRRSCRWFRASRATVPLTPSKLPRPKPRTCRCRLSLLEWIYRPARVSWQRCSTATRRTRTPHVPRWTWCCAPQRCAPTA